MIIILGQIGLLEKKITSMKGFTLTKCLGKQVHSRNICRTEGFTLGKNMLILVNIPRKHSLLEQRLLGQTVLPIQTLLGQIGLLGQTSAGSIDLF